MARIGSPTINITSKTEGGKREIRVSDDNVQNSLNTLGKELKKMNVYLSKMTDIVIKDADVNSVI